MVVSLAALFVALGGTGYAAFSLPKNSVGTKQLKNGAVTGPKIAAGSITGSKIANGTIAGANINVGTLGTVPTASNANHANTANTAGGAPPTGTAGGALAGSYPNPGLAPLEAVHRIGAPGEPAFQDSCIDDPGFEPGGFYKDGFGIVHLVGDIYECGAVGATVFTLPAGYRPANTLRFLIEDGNTDGATGVLVIESDGTVWNYVTKAPVINGITFRPN
jgi:hypothetical protein